MIIVELRNIYKVFFSNWYMKRGVGVVVICFALILVLSLSVVSAFSLGDFFRKIFGGKEVQLSPWDSLNVLIVAGDACGKSRPSA